MSIRTTMPFVLVFLGVASTAFGQGSARTAAAGSRVRLDFPGGTLEQYVDAVRRQVPYANIVVDGLESVKVPKAPLNSVSLPQALQWVITTADARTRGVILQPTRSMGDSAEVFVFTVAQAPVDRPPAKPEIVLWDHAIDSIPNRPDWPETMRAAVEAKLKRRDPQHPTGTVELSTREVSTRPPVLSVRGTRLDIQDAQQTVDELERKQRPNAVLFQLQAEVAKLWIQSDSLRRRVGELERRTPREESRP